jgi:arylformamidase
MECADMTKVFRDYDADALEQEYIPRYWPNISLDEKIELWIAMGKACHERSNLKTDLTYGDSDLQRLDLVLPNVENAPVLVFIHGGYWRNRDLNRASYSFCAEPIVKAGGLVAMIDYDLCPDVSLDEIVSQVRKSCAWVWHHIADYGGDPSRLHISGHSAGGHLTAMMAATDWLAYEEGLPANLVKSIIPVSGLFELEPLRLSSLNADLQLDPDAARRNSPQFLRPATRLPASVVVGGGESVEFRRQSRDFADAWHGMVGSMDFIETEDHNHFTVIEAMTEGEPSAKVLTFV